MNTSLPHRPAGILEHTLAFYAANAEHYATSTFNLDLGPEQRQFLASLPATAPATCRILDAGCGSGRDALAFASQGYAVTAFDGSAELVQQAQARTGLPVLHLRFADMAFEQSFEGIWACASLLHLPDEQLDQALARIHRALVPKGAFYACFKVGTTQRVDGAGRYFNDFTRARLTDYLTARGFDVEAVTLSGNKLDSRMEWVNAFSRKPGA